MSEKYERPRPNPETSHEEWTRKEKEGDDPAYAERDCIYYNGKHYSVDELIKVMLANGDKITCQPKEKGEI
jgi:hypothetical protein